MRYTAILAASLAALLALAACTAGMMKAGMVEDCAQERDPGLGISGCTAVIHSGQWQGKDLAWAYYNRGNAYYSLGDYARAIEDHDEALRLDPGNALFYSNRGSAYDELGEYRRAIEDYDEALRINPGYLDAYNNRGVAYDHLGEYARAIEDFDQALRLDPGDASYYNNRAFARCHLGQVEASLDDWMQVVRLGAGAPAAEELQRFMRDVGFYKGAINGDFGPSSQRALREWTVAGCPSPDE